jgi:hypothetical protein
MSRKIPESERCHPPNANVFSEGIHVHGVASNDLSALALPFAFVLRRGIFIDDARRYFWWLDASTANGTSPSDVSSNIYKSKSQSFVSECRRSLRTNRIQSGRVINVWGITKRGCGQLMRHWRVIQFKPYAHV